MVDFLASVQSYSDQLLGYLRHLYALIIKALESYQDISDPYTKYPLNGTDYITYLNSISISALVVIFAAIIAILFSKKWRIRRFMESLSGAIGISIVFKALYLYQKKPFQYSWKHFWIYNYNSFNLQVEKFLIIFFSTMAVFFFIQAFLIESSLESYLLGFSFLGLDIVLSHDLYINVFGKFFKGYIKEIVPGFLEIGWYVALVFTCFYAIIMILHVLRDYLIEHEFFKADYTSLEQKSLKLSSPNRKNKNAQ